MTDHPADHPANHPAPAGRPLWPALFGAPAMVLASQWVSYSLVTPFCAHQLGDWLRAVPVVFFIAVLASLAVALPQARLNRPQDGPPADGDRREVQRVFLARIATAVAALSALAVVALWLPPWWISPCTA